MHWNALVKPLCLVEERRAHENQFEGVYLQCVRSRSIVVCCRVAVTINGNRDNVATP